MNSDAASKSPRRTRCDGASQYAKASAPTSARSVTLWNGIREHLLQLRGEACAAERAAVLVAVGEPALGHVAAREVEERSVRMRSDRGPESAALGAALFGAPLRSERRAVEHDLHAARAVGVGDAAV